MSAFGTDHSAGDPFAPSPFLTVAIDVYTAAYRVSGETSTRFSRVADIVNQVTSTHLIVEHATVSEYADPSATMGALQVLITLDEILFVVAGEEASEARPEMHIPKRPVRAQFALPPFRLTGAVHIAPGSRPVDGMLNVTDRFLAMTDVAVACGAHPELGRTAPAAALQRKLAHLILVLDDERPDELLADVLDERTAERWLKPREPGGEP
jgi:hypothetical protein